MNNINKLLETLHNANWTNKNGLFEVIIGERMFHLNRTNCFGVELTMFHKIKDRWSQHKGPEAWEGGQLFCINTASLRDSGMCGRNVTMNITPAIANALENMYWNLTGINCDFEAIKALEYMKV
jgi:hypothetical protein